MADHISEIEEAQQRVDRRAAIDTRKKKAAA
jgi:hypothetical protein